MTVTNGTPPTADYDATPHDKVNHELDTVTHETNYRVVQLHAAKLTHVLTLPRLLNKETPSGSMVSGHLSGGQHMAPTNARDVPNVFISHIPTV